MFAFGLAHDLLSKLYCLRTVRTKKSSQIEIERELRYVNLRVKNLDYKKFLPISEFGKYFLIEFFQFIFPPKHLSLFSRLFFTSLFFSYLIFFFFVAQWRNFYFMGQKFFFSLTMKNLGNNFFLREKGLNLKN